MGEGSCRPGHDPDGASVAEAKTRPSASEAGCRNSPRHSRTRLQNSQDCCVRSDESGATAYCRADGKDSDWPCGAPAHCVRSRARVGRCCGVILGRVGTEDGVASIVWLTADQPGKAAGSSGSAMRLSASRPPKLVTLSRDDVRRRCRVAPPPRRRSMREKRPSLWTVAGDPIAVGGTSGRIQPASVSSSTGTRSSAPDWNIRSAASAIGGLVGLARDRRQERPAEANSRCAAKIISERTGSKPERPGLVAVGALSDAVPVLGRRRRSRRCPDRAAALGQADLARFLASRGMPLAQIHDASDE